MRKLNYISRLQRIPLSELPFETLTGNKIFQIPGCDGWPDVNCQRPVKLEITDKLEDGERLYTHKMTYRTCDDDIDEQVQYAYLLTDIDGKRYLIGSQRRPFPTISISEVHPDSYASSTLTEVTVQWLSKRQAPRIA